MNVAFYAPMKPPDAPRASGDRTIARLLLQAMAADGHAATVASRLRSHMAAPADADRLERLRQQGAAEASRRIDDYRRRPPDLWFTYHLFYKAPDLIGPPVCRALGLPYVVAEASLAPKQAAGPWAGGHALTRDAIGCADHVFFLNPADEACVLPALKAGATHSALLPPIVLRPGPPASDRRAARLLLARQLGVAPDTVLLLAVGMMRPGAKLASYALLAAAWARCADLPAQLLIAGDGPAADAVRAEFLPCADRVSFLGAQESQQLRALLDTADAFVWPGRGEAVGMATLEAMAAGLPVAVGPSGAVAGAIDPTVTGLVARTADEFAQALRRLVLDPDLRRTLGAAARADVARRHSLPAASAALTAAFNRVTGRAAALRST